MAPNDPTIQPTQDIPGAGTPPVDAPMIDMDVINEAVAAADQEVKTPQHTFNVNDISLDNTPTSDAELSQQMAANPGMSLAGGAPAASAAPAAAAPAEEASAAPVDYTNTSDPIDNPAVASAPASDPNGKPGESAGFVDGDIANDTPAAGDAANEAPVVAANVVTAPGAKKSNKTLFIALGGVAAVAIIIVAIIIIMSL